MKYSIEWMERVEGTKPRAKALLKDETGKTHENVTIWGDFPGFAELMTGHTIEGDLVPAKDPKFGPSLYPPKVKKSNGGFKQVQIEKAQDKKREDISHAQENKAHNVKVASTFRDATLLAIAEFQEQRRLSTTGETLEQLFKKWREFCWMNYDVNESAEYKPF